MPGSDVSGISTALLLVRCQSVYIVGFFSGFAFTLSVPVSSECGDNGADVTTIS